MSNTMWWYVMRSAGLTSWLFLTLTLMWGTVASGRMAPTARSRRWIVDLHPFLGAIGLGALALHVVAAVADTWVGLEWVDAFVPLTAGWHPWGVAAGVVALWLLAVVQVTSLARRRLGQVTWHRIHLLSYAMAWLTGLHAVMNGSDLGNPVIAWTALALMLAATSLALWRLWHPIGPREVVPPVAGPVAAPLAAPARPTFVARNPLPATPPARPPMLVDSSARSPSSWR